jgi:hypothetical protein
MAANAKQGYSLETATEAWAEARYIRNDFGERRKRQKTGIKPKMTQYLIPDDVATLNRIDRDEDRERRTSGMFFPGEAKEDHLRVEIVAPMSTSKEFATPPSYAEGRRPKSTTAKRKRVEDKKEEREESSIRKPVEEIPETESSRGSNPEQLQHNASTQSSERSSPRSPTPQPPPLECEGQAFAAALRKMLGLFSELEDPLYTAARCCDRCRGPLQRAVHCLQQYLAPIINDLENISAHTFGDEEVPSTQDHGISPYEPRKQRNPIFVQGDSEVD